MVASISTLDRVCETKPTSAVFSAEVATRRRDQRYSRSFAPEAPAISREFGRSVDWLLTGEEKKIEGDAAIAACAMAMVRKARPHRSPQEASQGSMTWMSQSPKSATLRVASRALRN